MQYFYEPFLEAYDPELRKELGVWYTPPEVVDYMVARVDTVLREELDLPDGPGRSARPRPRPVLRHRRLPRGRAGADRGDAARQGRRRAAGPRSQGGGDVARLRLRAAARALRRRALAVGPAAPAAGRPAGYRRARRHLPDQRADGLGAAAGGEAADHRRALPPGAGRRRAGEAGGADPRHPGQPALRWLRRRGDGGGARRSPRPIARPEHGPKPRGQGLNDLYVRFYRMAERRIVEQSGKGIVCFISNYSWLDGLSHPGMRERYLEVFDRIWIDSLNGDKYRTGKTTPEGKPDPSIFSTPMDSVGIQVGTAIALLMRKESARKSGAGRVSRSLGDGQVGSTGEGSGGVPTSGADRG